MGKLNIVDLLSFAKAGYSPKDVKELLEMDIPDNIPTPTNPEVIHAPEEKKAEENTPKESVQPVPSPDEAKTDDIDYKKLYEEEKEKVNRLQEANTKQDASRGETIDPMKGLDDFLVSLM